MSTDPREVDQVAAAQGQCVFPELPALPDVMAALVSGTHPRELFETMQPAELRLRSALDGAGWNSGRSICINPLISLPLAHESLDEAWEALESRGLLPGDAMTTNTRRFCLHPPQRETQARDADAATHACARRPERYRPPSLASMILWASAGAERLARAEALARTFYERLAAKTVHRVAEGKELPPFARVHWHGLSWAVSPRSELALSQRQHTLLSLPFTAGYANGVLSAPHFLAMERDQKLLRGRPGLVRDLPLIYTLAGTAKHGTTLSLAYALRCATSWLPDSPYDPLIELWHMGFGVLSLFNGTVHLGFAAS